MDTPFSSKLVIPSIALVITLVASLSVFTGSAYAQFSSPTEKVIIPESVYLSRNYPETILQWETPILNAALEYEIDPNLIAAVMLQESGGNPQAISVSGAIGLMQVMPKDGLAASFICSGMPCFSNRPSSDELLEPEFNIAYGAHMLSELIIKKGSLREALYHYGPYDMDYEYADRVISILETYR